MLSSPRSIPSSSGVINAARDRCRSPPGACWSHPNRYRLTRIFAFRAGCHGFGPQLDRAAHGDTESKPTSALGDLAAQGDRPCTRRYVIMPVRGARVSSRSGTPPIALRRAPCPSVYVSLPCKQVPDGLSSVPRAAAYGAYTAAFSAFAIASKLVALADLMLSITGGAFAGK
jgi:hypothetical protein